MNTAFNSDTQPRAAYPGNSHKRIAIHSLSANCGLVTARSATEPVDISSAATKLLVDFTQVHAITVGESVTVNDALEVMRTNGIRSLMVLGKNGEFTGVITAMDIMGRKPMVYANESGTPRSEVQVKNIMLPKNMLKAMASRDVEQASVADILRMFKTLNDQHILVVDEREKTVQISGMFSASDFKRALDIDVVDALAAHSFADLERVIYEKKEVI